MHCLSMEAVLKRLQFLKKSWNVFHSGPTLFENLANLIESGASWQQLARAFSYALHRQELFFAGALGSQLFSQLAGSNSDRKCQRRLFSVPHPGRQTSARHILVFAYQTGSNLVAVVYVHPESDLRDYAETLEKIKLPKLIVSRFRVEQLSCFYVSPTEMALGDKRPLNPFFTKFSDGRPDTKTLVFVDDRPVKLPGVTMGTAAQKKVLAPKNVAVDTKMEVLNIDPTMVLEKSDWESKRGRRRSTRDQSSLQSETEDKFATHEDLIRILGTEYNKLAVNDMLYPERISVNLFTWYTWKYQLHD